MQHFDADRPTAIIAFTGWNDAAEAASGAVEHLVDVLGAEEEAALSAEDFVDLQVNRPMVTLGEDGTSEITWPDTLLLRARTESAPLFLVLGPEPSHAWTTFVDELLGMFEERQVSQLIVLGALLSDTPHTRPLPITASDGEGPSDYEGPVGIPTLLASEAGARGFDIVSLWVQVPHYVGQTASPKAVLALINAVQGRVHPVVPLGDLEEESVAWTRGVDELAEVDPEIGEYVHRLEEAKDTSELPEASGDAIAAEVEQFLRRRREEN